MLRRLSIRARITLGSLLVGAVVLAGAMVALHLQIAHATLETDRSLAAADAAPFVSDLRGNPGEPPDRPAAGVLVGIRSADGDWVVDALPRMVSRALPRTVPDDEVTMRLRTPRGPVTVVGVPVRSADRTSVVWAARDGRAGHETLGRIDRSLVVGTLLALTAFGLAAWLLSTITLRPVSRMRRAAEDLGGGRTAGHLPVGPSDDELADLARTLNSFVDRQRENTDRERRIVSDASHELRTPLAALTARLELAHRSSGDAVALEGVLTAAESDVARLTSLAQTLLELSRLDEASDGDRRPATTTAEALVTEVMQSVDRARMTGGTGPGGTGTGATPVDVDFTVDLLDPARSYAVDPAAFARIVDNLVTNAVAHGTGATAVTIRLGQTPDRALRLLVEDDGPGIPEAFLPIAFERFARADAARRAGTGGAGLGLALVRGLAEHAGGSATLTNRRTGGASAAVVIPPA
nr:HAMP domain-containing sensor histidine kinase [Curtobacterium sp. WW7]